MGASTEATQNPNATTFAYVRYVSGWSTTSLLLTSILVLMLWFFCVISAVYSCTGDMMLAVCVSFLLPTIVSAYSKTDDKFGLALSFVVCYWLGYAIRKRKEPAPIVVVAPLNEVVIKRAFRLSGASIDPQREFQLSRAPLANPNAPSVTVDV